MKNNIFKKNKTLSFFILIMLVTGFYHNAEALKRAVFPDGKSLQPIPKDSYANVSGNINSEVNPSFIEIKKETTNTDNTIKVEEVTGVENSSSSPNYWLWSTVGLFILIIILVLYYKKRK